MPTRNDKNSALNLLSGWKASGSPQKIKDLLTKNRKVLVLDDCYADWLTPYDEIFGSGNHQSIPNAGQAYFVTQANSDYSEFKKSVEKLISSVDLILFDLYFTESHGEEYISNPQNIRNVSGYKIYEILKEIDPSIPVMIFSTSNKVWTYKLFDSMGIDGFSTKNPGLEPIEEELKSFYSDFEITFINLLKPEYRHLRETYKLIEEFNRVIHDQNYWWWKKIMIRRNKYVALEFEKKMKELLIASYLAIRRILSRQNLYEKELFPTILEFDSFTCSAIVGQLGNIPEFIYGSMRTDNIVNPLLKYVHSLRNKAAHHFHYQEFRILDIFIAAYATLFALLEKEEPSSELTFAGQGQGLMSLHQEFLNIYKVNSDSTLFRLLKQRAGR